MPIQLNYTDQDTGIALGTSYWFIQTLHVDQIANLITFEINGYNNIASKTAGKLPFKTKVIRTTFALLGITAASTLAQMLTAMYNFALTYSDPSFGAVFFTGGTIV